MLFRERQQIVICAVAGALMLWFMLFQYLPTRKMMRDIKQRKAEQKLVVTKATAQVGQLAELKKQLMQMETAVGNYEANIPSQRDIGVFLQQIADLMNEQKLNEQMIQPGQEVKTEKSNCIPVNMQCKGKLKQIFGFYKSLHKLDRLIRIEQVSLINDGNFGGEVNMQTKAMIYYSLQAEQG